MVTHGCRRGRRGRDARAGEEGAVQRNQHGDRLPSERDLADQFKVSRSSVREAIRSLELQGLVVSKRGSGTFINTDNLESVLALIAATLNTGGENLTDVFEMRHLLEPPIAALAAQRRLDAEPHPASAFFALVQSNASPGHSPKRSSSVFLKCSSMRLFIYTFSQCLPIAWG